MGWWAAGILILAAFQDVKPLLESADRKLQKGDLDGALADYSKAVEQDPRSAEALSGRGIARQRKGDLPGALKDLDQALQIDASHPVALVNRAYVLNLQGRYEDALGTCTRAIQAAPQDPYPYGLRGDIFLQLKQPQRALDEFAKAVARAAGNPHYLLRRSEAYRELRQHQLALEDCTRAIELGGRTAGALVHLGNLRFAMKDFKGAAENYSDALLLEPNAAYLHRNRGMARYRLKDYRRAVEDASRAVELDPKFVQAWFDRAYARQKLKDAAGALEDCARAIALAPDARSFRVRSDIRRFLGDARGASEDADRALQLDPRDPWSHLARGLTREMSGDFAGAVKDYGEGLRIEPNHARCLSSRGYARSILGDRKEALEDLEASCASEPKDEEMPRIWIYLNRARDGDEQAAVELDARVRKWTEARPDGWTTRLGRFFVGEETEAALLRAAEDPVHEAQFYVGMRRLLAGHLDGAAMAFRKCVSLGGNDWAAQASKVELARLPRTERKAIPIRHASPSFRLTIPAGYSRAPVVPPNAAYAFTRTIEDRPDSVFALSLEVLRGMIRRDKPSEADVALLARTHLPPGATFVLRKEKWGEFDIDLMETRMHQNGLDLITLVVQVPLAPQALQIAAAGPAALESKVHADLLQVLSSVEGQSSWLTEGERTLALATGLPTLIGWVLFVVYGLLVLILFRGEPLRAWRFRFAWLATAAACLGVGFVLHLAYQDARGRDPSAFLVPVAAVYCGVLAARILRRSRTARVRLAGAGAEVDATPAPSKRPLSPAVAALLTWFAVVAGGVFLFQALGLVRSTAALEKLGSGLASMGFLIAVVAYVGARRRLRAWEEKGRTPVRRRREPRLPVPDGRCRRCRAAVPDGERPWEKLGYCSLDCLRLQRK